MTKLVEIKGGGRPAEIVAQCMADEIKDVIYSYEGEALYALAIGVLEMVKADLIEEAQR